MSEGADYTVEEFAGLIRQSKQAVYRQCRSGKIPYYKIGRSVRIRREDGDRIRRPRTDLDPVLREKIKATVDGWSPLTPEQREAIAALFNHPQDGGVVVPFVKPR